MSDKKCIIFFDDDCGFCTKAIQFVFNHDAHKIFYFSPGQGETAQQEIGAWRKEHPDVDSIVLLEVDERTGEKTISCYSSAVFRIIKELSAPWSFFGFLSLLPLWLLIPFDWCYKAFARTRKRWCDLPAAKQDKQKRFDGRFLP